ncbi:Uncharacterized protein FWK35_00009426 [Aphis craccivora]|uniref:Uncharacterized protein n=1 Tax=Aphis craccivora TaxID=307492 RepID=A0A6G0Z6J1_APHCR|nr:Uncharacterized protein FWK35_00009426 [Aphis craccivora]
MHILEFKILIHEWLQFDIFKWKLFKRTGPRREDSKRLKNRVVYLNLRKIFCLLIAQKKINRYRYAISVIPDAFENYWKFFTFDPPKYQLNSLSYQKQGPLFKIGALLLLQNVVTDTKKKKKPHIIVKSIHSSLRSESKKNCNKCIIQISKMMESIILVSKLISGLTSQSLTIKMVNNNKWSHVSIVKTY